MRLILKAFPLDKVGTPYLRKILAGDRSNKSVDALMQHVASLGATWAIVEDPYTDLDYSSDYQNFYAGAFKDYPRRTKRLHLFRQDVSPLLELDPAAQAKAFETLGRDDGYLGFVVVRPIPQGPVGRTVLPFPDLGEGLTVRPAARAEFKSNFVAAELTVKGAPFIQQETRVGACAQAAIWMASLAVQTRHRRTIWHSMADITRLAGTPTDASLSQALPAGSGGLNPIHMIRALRGMGHQPLFDLFKDEHGHDAEGPSAANMVMRYLDSGLPVILTIGCIQHALTAVGYVETAGAALRDEQTYDAFVHALVVHDDQRGPYRLLPLTKTDIDALPRDRLLMNDDTVLTVEDLSHMFVPLPPRVFLPADRVDLVAKDFLKRQMALRKPYADLLHETPEAAGRLAEFFDLVMFDQLVRRTYLTTAARYRHHLAQNTLSDDVKDQLLFRSLPHFVWVTELLAPDAAQQGAKGPRPILGHIVTDASSSSDPNSDLIMAHIPHVVVHRDPNAQAAAWKPGDLEFPDKEDDEDAVLVEQDGPYLSRIRNF